MARKHVATKKARLAIERLEDRQLLAGNVVFDPVTRVLSITGTSFDDKATVQVNGANVVAHLEYDDGSGLQNEDLTVPASQVASLLFNGNDGDDWFCNDTAILAKGYGGAGNDYLEGGLGVDRFFGGLGNDVLVGFKGNDKLLGEAGDDWLFGIQTNDQLEGGAGNDGLFGGTGADVLKGGAGTNTLQEKDDGPLADVVEGFASAKLQAYLDSQGSGDSSSSEIERAIIDLVNLERTSRGLAALTVNAKLVGAAQHHATNMANFNRMAHELPQADLPTLLNRLSHYGYNYRAAGENIAWNYQSAQHVMNGWMNSSGHRANILSTSYTEIGVGVRYASNGSPYYCQVFGRQM